MKFDPFETIVVGGFILVTIALLGNVVEEFYAPTLSSNTTSSTPKTATSLPQNHQDKVFTSLTGGFSTDDSYQSTREGTVQWSDLAKLVNSIDIKQDLAEASTSRIGLSLAERDRWNRALQQAKALEAGMCDCDQVNYLNHFIECGQHAVKGNSELADDLVELQSLKMEK